MTLGIDIGGTTISLGLVNEGRITREVTVPSFSHDADLEQTLEYLSDQIEGIITPDTGKIGIGVPSVLDIEKGIVYDALNIPSWKEVHLKSYLEDRFGLPVAINNDANCFAMGAYGSFRDEEKPEVLVGITLGTGVGLGIVDRGRLLCGANGGAGELGSLPYLEGIIEDYCGKKFFTSRGWDGLMAAEAAVEGDQRAIRLFESFGKHLSELVSAVLFAYDPSHIIFGGGIAKAWEHFQPSLENNLRETFPYQNSLGNLVMSPIIGENVQLIGASLI